MSSTHLLFGIPVRSLIPLPELPECQVMTPSVTIGQVNAGWIDPKEFATCHEWRGEQDRLICRCARRGADYLLSFPRQADFHIEAGGNINCIPAPGTGQGLLRHLLLNQVLPRYFAHTGELLLHASAVTLPNGNTVAFLGKSGCGKSTLASFCQLRGAQMIDDDCLLLRCGEQGACITGGVPTLRLYPDSLRALGHSSAGFVLYADGSNKLQMHLAPCATPAAPRVLHALYLLGVPEDTAANTAVSIAPAGGQVAMMSMLRSAFTLNPADRNTLSGTFQRVARMLVDGLPVYHLNFPREHAALPRVLQALLNGPCA